MKLIATLLGLALLAIEGLTTSLPALRYGIKPKDRRGILSAPIRRQYSVAKSCGNAMSPKFFILSAFHAEGEIWYREYPSILAQNLTIPGLSPLFPDAHCNANGSVCQVTMGEGEINAASSVTAIWTSNCFDLTSTYFMVAGIAGINPHRATTGSVTFSRYAVQFDLQYEFAESQVPSNDTSGWFPQDADYPDEYKPRDYPRALYGTEVFELNEALKQRAVTAARKAKLFDAPSARKYRKNYPYPPANKPPSVVECDTGTSNNYWSGSVLAAAFEAYTLLLTNGSGRYCATQQEDNAVLESLLRANLAGKADLSRVIVMRTASDFDRAPPDEEEVYHLLYADQGGFEVSITNIYRAGIEIINDVLENWESVFAKGITPTNYVGDAFDSLNSKIKPDIGTPAFYIH